ncbi:MAG: hypothetical protein IPJ65_19305 [Archangiaceae bacterium]|nr:hypothetical protein [Archangiaceae bacterium]
MSDATMKQWAVVAVVLAGCDQQLHAGDLPDGGHQQQNPDASFTGTTAEKYQQLCERVAAIDCEAAFRCDCKARYQYPNMAACLADHTCPPIGNAVAVKDGRVVFDDAAAEANLTRYQADAKACTLSTGYFGAPLVGMVAPGGDCSFDWAGDTSPRLACKPGLVCELSLPVPDAGLFPAQCAPLRQDGQACTGQDYGLISSCDSYQGGTRRLLYCDLQGAESGAGVCRHTAAAHQACTSSVQCESVSCSSGVCAATDTSNRSDLFCGPDQCALKSSGGTGTNCGSTWTCRGSTYGATCTVSGTTTTCSCTKDTVVTGNFTSQGFCTAKLDTQAAAVAAACGWDILAP